MKKNTENKDIKFILEAMAKSIDSPPTVLFPNSFQVLISTILSARTKDVSTARASKKLFACFPDAESLSKAKLSKVKQLVKGCGFYNEKAKNIINSAKIIIKEYNGQVPSKTTELVKLPGVGKKTAACVRCYAFGLDDICVDTHVHRISNRLGLVNTKEPEQTQKELKKTIPKKYWKQINHAMVKFGQKVCLPRKPRCGQCPVAKECDYFGKLG